MEAALEYIAPMILGAQHTFKSHNFGDKPSLLKKLPDRLRGYRSWLPNDWLLVVLIDEDRQDCHDLKDRLENIAVAAGYKTKSNAVAGDRFHIINRIVIEELEAWFFGDIEALVTAYHKISRNLENKARFRDPDAISGGTWEAMERVLQKKGYYPQRLPKIEVAEAVSQHMDPDRNRSRSFQVFRDGLREALNV